MKINQILVERSELHEFFSDIAQLYLIGYAEHLKSGRKMDEFEEFVDKYDTRSDTPSDVGSEDEEIFPLRYRMTTVNILQKWEETGDKKYTDFLNHLMDNTVLMFYNNDDGAGGFYRTPDIYLNAFYKTFKKSPWDGDDQYDNISRYIMREFRTTLIHEVTHAYQDFMSKGQYGYNKYYKEAPKELRTILFKKANKLPDADKMEVTHKGVDYKFINHKWLTVPQSKHRSMKDDHEGYWLTDYEMDARFTDAVDNVITNGYNRGEWDKVWGEISNRVFGKHKDKIPAKKMEYFKRRAAKIYNDYENRGKTHISAKELLDMQNKIVNDVEDDLFWTHLENYAKNEMDRDTLNDIVDDRIGFAIRKFEQNVGWGHDLPYTAENRNKYMKIIKSNVKKKLTRDMNELIDDYMAAGD